MEVSMMDENERSSSSSSSSPMEVEGDTVTAEDKDTDSGSDAEYDTDIEPCDEIGSDAGDESARAESRLLGPGVASYQAACELLGITPVGRVVRYLGTTNLHLSYRCMGPAGAKALATALMTNATVHKLSLEENGLEGEGMAYLADMLKENYSITHLNLARNNLGSLGAFAIGEMMKQNMSITHLDLSGNNFRDVDAVHLAEGIEKNERIIDLNLSQNGLSEDGAILVGRALGINNFIEVLDLSWNKIRRRGAVSVCHGLKRNYCVHTVNLGWNGIGQEGTVSVGEMLRGNKYIRELDISHNRLNWSSAMLVARGLKENDTLEVLKIGHNPLTMTGCLDILEAVDTPISVMTHLGFDGIPVNRKVVYMAETIHKYRPFKITHNGQLDSEDIFGRRMVLRCDPLKLLIQYLSDKGIRPVDLFRTFDQDSQHRVTREQFIQGLKKAGAPLDDYEIERVLNRLDSAKEGKISYQRLLRGVKEQIRFNREEERKRLGVDPGRPLSSEDQHGSPWPGGIDGSILGDGGLGLTPLPASAGSYRPRPGSASSTSTLSPMLDLKAELDATSRLTTLQPEMSTLSDTGDQPQAETGDVTPLPRIKRTSVIVLETPIESPMFERRSSKLPPLSPSTSKKGIMKKSSNITQDPEQPPEKTDPEKTEDVTKKLSAGKGEATKKKTKGGTKKKKKK